MGKSEMCVNRFKVRERVARGSPSLAHQGWPWIKGKTWVKMAGGQCPEGWGVGVRQRRPYLHELKIIPVHRPESSLHPSGHLHTPSEHCGLGVCSSTRGSLGSRGSVGFSPGLPSWPFLPGNPPSPSTTRSQIMIAQWKNECISLSGLAVARVVIGQWENDCFSLSVLSVARVVIVQWENEFISLPVLSLYSLNCSLAWISVVGQLTAWNESPYSFNLSLPRQDNVLSSNLPPW